MLQAINSSTNNNSKKIPFGYSYRLNIPNKHTTEALNYLEGFLELKNIPQTRFVRSQPPLGEQNAVIIVEHKNFLDVFVKEKVSRTPENAIDVNDSGVLYRFANEKILPIFQ